MGLSDKVHDKVGTFSGGMKTRVSLASALVHDPRIIILDEPTAGLDPVLKKEIWKLFRNFTTQEKTIIVSTHLMEEALQCDELIVMQEGKLIAQNSPQEILSKGRTEITVTKNDSSTLNKTLSSQPSQIADYLQTLGLDDDIDEVEISQQNLEEILIQLFNSNSDKAKKDD